MATETRECCRTAVEKALAEQDFRSSRDFFAWKAQEEARHSREIERARAAARIEEAKLIELESDLRGHASEILSLVVEGRLLVLRAELAALTTSEPQTEGEVKP